MRLPTAAESTASTRAAITAELERARREVVGEIMAAARLGLYRVRTDNQTVAPALANELIEAGYTVERLGHGASAPVAISWGEE